MDCRLEVSGALKLEDRMVNDVDAQKIVRKECSSGEETTSNFKLTPQARNRNLVKCL
jgi:hypothetical protein